MKYTNITISSIAAFCCASVLAVDLTLPSSTSTLATLGLAETLTSKTLTSPVLTTPTINGVALWEDGTRQTFNPNGTNSGFNVGSQAGDPSTPSNGDLWYDSTANELTARINGANVALGSGGGVTDGDKGDITVSASGATFTIDADVVTFAKFQNITDGKLLGRSAGSTGDMQEITVGSGLSLSAGTLTATGGGASGDLVAPLVNTEVSVTGAATATISKMHVCSGSSDYTLTLPAVSGNTGKFIGVRVTSTAYVTLDGNASETIDGDLTRKMWKGESAILECDGVNWYKVAGKMLPMAARLSRTTAQSITSGADTKITLDSEDVDLGGIADPTTNNRIDIKRAGKYFITARVSVANMDTAELVYVQIWKNGTKIHQVSAVSAGTNQWLVAAENHEIMSLAENDYLELYIWHTEGASQNSPESSLTPDVLEVAEIVIW